MFQLQRAPISNEQFFFKGFTFFDSFLTGPNVLFKALSHLASTSMFTFPKIIETMVENATQRMGSISILYVNINISLDTMLNFDANVNTDALCERTFNWDRS